MKYKATGFQAGGRNSLYLMRISSEFQADEVHQLKHPFSNAGGTFRITELKNPEPKKSPLWIVEIRVLSEFCCMSTAVGDQLLEANFTSIS